MQKTTIYLEPELDRALARLAAERRISKAELIRAALRRALEDAAPPPLTAIGVGEGPGDVAQQVDHHLDETGFGER